MPEHPLYVGWNHCHGADSGAEVIPYQAMLSAMISVSEPGSG